MRREEERFITEICEGGGDTRLVLYEHQSTINENLPLRDLFYVARQYEQLMAGRDLYGKTKIKLPAPRFIVFYNGKAKQPEKKEIKLSEAYFIKEEQPNLELKVVQLNINPGYNEELKRKCPTLHQYMLYVEKVRSYEKSMPIKEAVERAVDECIQEGILRDFLMHEKAQVVSMSIFEFDQELHDKTLFEDGKAEGMKEGVLSALINLVRDGLLDQAEAAKRAGLTEEQFGRKCMEK